MGVCLKTNSTFVMFSNMLQGTIWKLDLQRGVFRNVKDIKYKEKLW